MLHVRVDRIQDNHEPYQTNTRLRFIAKLAHDSALKLYIGMNILFCYQQSVSKQTYPEPF